ncbi:hypothetical protein RDWZM_003132 [Blomia tropicalis]|uniref:Phospholipid-transporting ATPase n=1 Tax=Blomia tropicalis TaxID=40697 RepID=A0A9Q0MFB1_BLOTA|nr:hypothetical protein RDWZM_003132 [Blomia tropicalis]
MPTQPAVNDCKSRHRRKTRLVTPNISISDGNLPPHAHPNFGYANNKISTSKYTWLTIIPKNLFEQFHRYANLYFLVIQVLNWLPGIDVFVKELQLLPLSFVLTVTLIKDLFEDRRRHRSDKVINNLTCRRYDKNQKRFIPIPYKEIVVGDLVHLSCDEKVPADILILKSKLTYEIDDSDEADDDDDQSGICYVDTANLDGESNLKQRFAVNKFSNVQIEQIDFNFVVECEKPNMSLHKLNGFIMFNRNNEEKISINKDNFLLRDYVLKNTSYVEGLVIYAGHETKAMLSNKGPRLKKSRLEKTMNGDILWCIVTLIILCTISSLGRLYWLDQFDYPLQRSIPFLIVYFNAPFPSLEFVWSFFSFVILYQMIIPISLYVCIEMVKLGQVYYIQSDELLHDKATNKKIECRAMNITEDLGQIEYMFCDKTGTLTENKMKFVCCTIKGVNYDHVVKEGKHKSKETYEQSTNDHKRTIKLNTDLKTKLKRITSEYSKCMKMEIGLRKSKKKPKNKYSIENIDIHLNVEEEMIRDFFILLAICNTALATPKDAHKDSLDSFGSYSSSQSQSPSSKGSSSSYGSSKSSGNHSESSINKMSDQKKDQKSFPDSCFDKKKRSTSKIRPNYKSESPDEVALVNAAYNYKVALQARGKDYVKVMMPNGMVIIYDVLVILPFDSNRKRMSIVVRCPLTHRIILFCKGSDTTILENLSKNENNVEKMNELKKTKNNLTYYCTKGYRILCMARRFLTDEEFSKWCDEYQKINFSSEYTEKIAKCFEKIECELELLGATGIEDRLQYRVPEVISSFRLAGIVIWVLTGDKMETAINIANSCSLFNNSMNLIIIGLDKVKSLASAQQILTEKIAYIRNTLRIASNRKYSTISKSYEKKNGSSIEWIKDKSKILYHILNWEHTIEFADQTDRFRWGLVIDGPSLNFLLDGTNLNLFVELTQYCSSVLCCRVSPSQKSLVVNCVQRKLNVLTMAVGDGANDVPMIQMAHVGVGISGLEGTQAVMAADFAISKFHYLERLILVHGNLCYNRLAKTILYFFYKNMLVIFTIFFFQFSAAFSGQTQMDDIYLMAVNVMYTTFPAMVRGIFEKDCPEQVFQRNPILYERGRKSRVYTKYSFWVNTTDSIYQSCVIYYIPYFAYYDSSLGIFEFGVILFTLVIVTNLLQIALETKYWNKWYYGSFVLSFTFYFTTIYILDDSYGNRFLKWFDGHNYKIFENILRDAKFWFILVVTPIACLIPRVSLRVIQDMIKPQI